MKKVLKCVLAGALLSVLTCSAIFAQGAAQINGTVSDVSGAVLPGVEITATHTGTSVMRTTVSNETGSYILSNLAVGPYRLEVTLPGFRTFVQTGIVLQVNANVTINAVLEVGQLTESIEVSANVSMVETRSTGVGQVITNEQILELPLIGRQASDLVVLAGAAVQTYVSNPSDRSLPGIAKFSIAGGLDTGISFTLDGLNHNDVRQGQGLPLPFPDALQEFKVETSAVPAQYGFRSGGAVNAVTKSGGNEFHGGGFWFVRNDKFNARNFFATGPEPLKRNQFGGTLGGPVVRNKLFFFGGYQGTTDRTAASSNRSFVPTPAMLAGDFTAFASAACQGTDRLLRSPFVNNRISPSQLSPAAVNVAKRLPTPIDECGLVQWGAPDKRDDHFVVAKVDYSFSNTHTVFGRYLHMSQSSPHPFIASQNPLITVAGGFDNQFKTLAIGDTLTFNSNMVNSFRANWTSSHVARVSTPYFGNEDVGIKNFVFRPHILSVNVTNGFDIGGTSAAEANFREASVQVTDDFSIVTGGHQVGFGGSLIGYQTNNYSDGRSNGTYVFNSTRTGLGLADFMAGLASSIDQDAPSFQFVRPKYLGLYAQDTWQVRPNLTLSGGLRWDPFIAPDFNQAAMVFWDRDAFLRNEKSPQYVNSPAGLFFEGDPQWPTKNSNPSRSQWNRFSPRLGLSWDPLGDGRTVIKAAYGIFHESVKAEQLFTMNKASPLGARLQEPNVSFDDPWGAFPGGSPFPYERGPNARFPARGTFSWVPPNAHQPYVQQWNFGIQREVAPNWMLSASYVGNLIVHLYGAIEMNPAVFFPGNANASGQCFTTVEGRTVSTVVAAGAVCSTIANTEARRELTLLNPVHGPQFAFFARHEDGGTRSYNGMLLSLQKRMASNFSFTANYTWSHCIGTLTTDFLNTPGGGQGLKDPNNREYDRGNCENLGADIRHIANGTAVFQMPQFSNTWTQRLLGQWRLSGILRADSGSHFTIYNGTDRALTARHGAGQRANQVLSDPFGNKCTDDLIGSGGKCFFVNRDAFAIADPGTLGNSMIGAVNGPGAWTIDAGLSRTFNITETHRMEFRAESTNVLNHTNFYNPNGSLNSGQFGRLERAKDPRIMQFGFKYIF